MVSPKSKAMRRLGKMTSASSRLRVSALLTVFAFWLLAFAFAPARAHEPITTKVRFNKEVIRIFQRNCLGCHKPEGIAMSLATYEEARPWAKAIKEEMLEKRMPPWHAVKGYGEFANAPKLTQREIDLLVNWVEGGAPKGEDKDLPAAPLYSNDWQLGKPDLILKPATVEQVAADTDEHRTITLETNLKQDRWLAAIDLRPASGAVVHCATLSYKQMLSSYSHESRGGEPPAGAHRAVSVPLTTWKPGQKTVRLPEGVAQLLPANSRVVVKIHYRNINEAATDQSEVGLYFTKPPRKQATEIAINDQRVVIPAGAAAHRVRSSFIIHDDAEAVAIRPLSHPLIASLQATAYRPDGTEEVLIWTRGYWQDWQQTYHLKRPAPLPRGTRVEVIAYFDNSDSNRMNPNDPPKQVRLSELSQSPLCAILISRPRATAD